MSEYSKRDELFPYVMGSMLALAMGVAILGWTLDSLQQNDAQRKCSMYSDMVWLKHDKVCVWLATPK